MKVKMDGNWTCTIQLEIVASILVTLSRSLDTTATYQYAKCDTNDDRDGRWLQVESAVRIFIKIGNSK